MTEPAETKPADYGAIFGRLNRVQAYMIRNDAKYGSVKSNLKTYSRGVKTKDFPERIWLVTEAMLAAGVDPNVSDKTTIYQWADHVLFAAAKPESIAAAAAAAQATATPAAAAEPVDHAVRNASPAATVDLSIAVYALLTGASQLIANNERAPGWKERLRKIDELAEFYCGKSTTASKTPVAQSEPVTDSAVVAVEPTGESEAKPPVPSPV